MNPVDSPNPGSASAAPWGLVEAAVGWIAFQIVGTVVAVAALQAGGWTVFVPSRPGGYIGRAVGQIEAGVELVDEAVPVVVQLATLAPGWLALLGGPLLFASLLGHARPGWRVEFRPRDIPLGVTTGVLLQIPLIAILYTLIQLIFGEFTPSNRAQTLIDRIDTPIEVAALVLFVAVGAPVVEELFYRGLIQRALVDRFGAIAGVTVTGVVFGAVHFSVIEFPALTLAGIAFGALYQHTGRLAAPMIAHVTFNLFTVVFLLLSSG